MPEATGGGNKQPGVALYLDPAIVDYDPANIGSEASNLEFVAIAAGVSYTPFTGFTEADFSNALAGKATLAIPEMEFGDLNGVIDPAARLAIESFVANGGTLVFFDTYTAPNLINATFGFGIAFGSSTEPYTITPSAAGTPFSGGPATLPWNDATDALSMASLPAGSNAIYQGVGGNPVVALMPYGAGRIVFLGWDWYDAQPFGAQDGGWNEVMLRAALGY